ncbi:hypothetical protein [Nocardia wallacei]|uniref:hypothetical protein n=1 Tax=Nocardia wallacei TaxID=480035 RepID=UPI002455D30B|nr:hypothetical protein [Nocardia wallacei]
MPLFGRGRAPKYVRLGTTPVMQAVLDELVVFDGTIPAVVPLPRATAAAAAVTPQVAAGGAVAMPTATAVSEARTPTITAGGTLAAPPAQAGTAGLVPQISAGASIGLPVAQATATAIVPDTQVVTAGEVLLPRAEAAASALMPTVEVVAGVAPPAAAAVAEALVPTVVGGAEVTLPAPSASAAANVPALAAGGSITLPRAQAPAAALLPIIGAGAAITLPAASASAAALSPTMFAGAYFTDDFNRSNSTSIGSQWVEDGNVAITSNALALDTSVTTNQRRGAIYNTPTATPFQSVEFVVGSGINGTATAGAVLRCNSGRTQMFILATYNGGWNLGRITGLNGTYTAVGAGTATITAGTVVRVQVDENNVWSVYLNGVKSGLSYRDTTWADSSHQYLGLFVQRVSNTNSHSIDSFVGKDVQPYSQFVADDFDRAALGGDWTTRFGPLYLASNQLTAVGLASEPISFAWHNTPSPTADMAAEARIRWNGRNPQHSSLSVCVRADPASSHGGVHFWCVADNMGIAMYNWAGTEFTPATGTDALVPTSKFPDGARMRLEVRGTVYTAFVDSVPVLQGTFTTAQVPTSNRYIGVHGEDDSAVSGGGEPPGALDEMRGYAIAP